MAVLAVDRHVAEGRGVRPALFVGERAVTFEELGRLTNRWGNALKGLGVRPGDRIALRLGTTLECMVGILGGLKIGAVPIPTNPLLRAREMEAILENSGAVLAITSPELLGVFEEVRGRCPALREVILAGGPGPRAFEALMARASEDLSPADTNADDLAFILYTSGTTGAPKGVEHAHRWLIGTGEPVGRMMMGLTVEDVCLQPQDVSFMYPFGCNFFYPLYCGAAVVVYTGRFDPGRVLDLIARRRVTTFAAVPTLYRMLLAAVGPDARGSLGALRRCISAGEPLPTDTFTEWRDRFGVEVLDGFGQTEAHIFVANVPGQPVKPGSMGQPLPGYEVRVVDDAGDPCPPDTPGHLVVRRGHPGFCLGYRGIPERWAALQRGDWYDTQDYAQVDPDGYYWYVSRADDLIKSRGYLISPKEVESALMDHPDVLEAGVVGAPDAVMGQRVRAFVTLKPGRAASPELGEKVREHVKATLAPYKAPQEVEFVSELPKTLTGKVLRRELRSRAG
ncbi:MAG TPA: benzoate-CoA ligase family protein [Candidatus Methylomirabilis sp.]|jgi:benzoate-CoA ligase family protein